MMDAKPMCGSTTSESIAPRRLSFGGNSRSPIWLVVDSRRVAYRSDREGAMSVYWQAADGTGAAERLTPVSKGTRDWPHAFSPDGRVLLFDRAADGRTSLWQLTLADRKESRVGTIASSQLTGAVFSPDGSGSPTRCVSLDAGTRSSSSHFRCRERNTRSRQAATMPIIRCARRTATTCSIRLGRGLASFACRSRRDLVSRSARPRCSTDRLPITLAAPIGRTI